MVLKDHAHPVRLVFFVHFLHETPLRYQGLLLLLQLQPGVGLVHWMQFVLRYQ
jgi:hypothetical protein